MQVLETKESFERHVELYKASKLSKAEYCKANNLRYHQFNYWVRKRAKRSTALVPVKLKPSAQHDSQYLGKSTKVLCILEFGRNGCLKIYDIEAMASILERIL